MALVLGVDVALLEDETHHGSIGLDACSRGVFLTKHDGQNNPPAGGRFMPQEGRGEGGDWQAEQRALLTTKRCVVLKRPPDTHWPSAILHVFDKIHSNHSFYSK